MIVDNIKRDIKEAMYRRNKKTLSLLRTVIGELNRKKVKELTDNDVIQVIKKMKENAILLNDNYEIELLSKYLPNILSEQETTDIVTNHIQKGHYMKTDMGKIMKELKSEYGHTLNMKLVSGLVKLNLLN